MPAPAIKGSGYEQPGLLSKVVGVFADISAHLLIGQLALGGCSSYEEAGNDAADGDTENQGETFGEVTEIIDGNTFVLDNGQLIDLIGIAAPVPAQRCYNESVQDLKELLLGKRVRLEADSHENGNPTGNGPSLPRYVFTTDDETLINEEMLRRGNVWLQQSETSYTDHQSELEEAASEARNKGAGCAWDGCVLVDWIADGDTFYYVNHQNVRARVRLLGIDTTEQGEDCYDRAGDALTVFIGDRYVRLERDDGAESKDEYGRELRYVSLCEAAATGVINLRMVEEGLACVAWADGLSLETALYEAQQHAQLENSACWADNPRFCR